MTRLRPMEDDEYGPYLQVLKDSYIRDMVESGLMEPADAEAKADADIEAHLSDGLRTSDTYIYVIEDQAGQVGYAWMAIRPDQVGKPIAFVFDIWIAEDFRGRGLGRTAMLALEEEARGLGLDVIRLNVFGHNAAARRLYRSLGYEELSLLMGKSLAG